VPVTLNVGASARHRQFTQELRWATPPAAGGIGVRRLLLLPGAVEQTFTVNGPLADVQRHPAGAWNNVSSDGRAPAREQLCLFGQSTWHATPRWDLTAGVRATYEDKRARVVRYAPTGGAASSPAPRWLRATHATACSIPARCA
jgi:iron complex outermembrane receptor protein